jgi:hypothetical protein
VHKINQQYGGRLADGVATASRLVVFQFLEAALPQFEVVEGDDDERMADFFVRDHLGDVRDGHEPRGEVFALVEAHGMFGPAILDEHGVTGVVQDGGVGVDAAEQACVFAFVAGFLAQLAHGGDHGVGLAGVHHAAGNFEFHGVGAEAVLLHHDKFLSGSEGDDVHPMDAFEDEKVVLLLGARGDIGIRAQLEDAKIAQQLGADFFPGTAHATAQRVRRKGQRQKGILKKLHVLTNRITISRFAMLYNQPPDFEAEIRFLTEEEGGRRSRSGPVKQGYRCDVHWDRDATDLLYMIWPSFLDENGHELEKGTAIPSVSKAYFYIVSPKSRHIINEQWLRENAGFDLREGNHVVAACRVTKIINTP